MEAIKQLAFDNKGIQLSRYPVLNMHWQWNTQKAPDVVSLAEALYPWLGARRQEQIMERLVFWASYRDGRRRGAA